MAKRATAAKKNGAGANGAGTGEGETEGYVLPNFPLGKHPSKTMIKELVRDGRIMREETQELSGTYGAQVKKAAEEHGLHKKALANARACDRMEAEKLAEYFAHFFKYCQDLGLFKKAADAPRLSLEEGMAGSEDGDGEDDGAPRGANVKTFPAPTGASRD